MTILTNRSFIHLITPENLFISTPIRPVTDFTNQEQDSFIYITIKRYMSKEFYGVIIDISAFKKSITGYK